jgi:phage shock protein PspC (stress-responsive transcriptional regulator)
MKVKCKQNKLVKMAPYARLKLKDKVNQLNNSIYLAGFFSLVACLVPPSYIWAYDLLVVVPKTESIGDWLTRSGAIMSAVVVLGQLLAMTARNKSKIDDDEEYVEEDGAEWVRDVYEVPVKVINVCVVVIALLGLIINSHADLFTDFSIRLWFTPFGFMAAALFFIKVYITVNDIFIPPWNKM